jgi:hypothetical protein
MAFLGHPSSVKEPPPAARALARRFPPFLSALLAAAALAGCGSSQPAAQLAAKADPICEATVARREAANASLSHAPSSSGPRALKAIAQTSPGLAIYESNAVAQLRKLDPPASLARTWRSMLGYLQQLADDTARLGTLAKQGDLHAAKHLLTESKATRANLVAVATLDGITPCGQAN